MEICLPQTNPFFRVHSLKFGISYGSFVYFNGYYTHYCLYLNSATETKTVAGDLRKLPQDSRGLIAKYMAYLEREGYYQDTSDLDLIKTLVKDGANLLDPENVKTKIARHKWKDSVKC
jgi:cellobiose phosphorylase